MILISQILGGCFFTQRLETDGHVFILYMFLYSVNLCYTEGWFHIPPSFHEGVPFQWILEPILIFILGELKVMFTVSKCVLNSPVSSLGTTLTPRYSVSACISTLVCSSNLIHGNGQFPFCSGKLGYAFIKKFASFCWDCLSIYCGSALDFCS